MAFVMSGKAKAEILEGLDRIGELARHGEDVLADLDTRIDALEAVASAARQAIAAAECSDEALAGYTYAEIPPTEWGELCEKVTALDAPVRRRDNWYVAADAPEKWDSDEDLRRTGWTMGTTRGVVTPASLDKEE